MTVWRILPEDEPIICESCGYEIDSENDHARGCPEAVIDEAYERYCDDIEGRY